VFRHGGPSDLTPFPVKEGGPHVGMVAVSLTPPPF
jgi:hypothetical protein